MGKSIKYAMCVLIFFSLSTVNAQDAKLQGEKCYCKGKKGNTNYSTPKKSVESKKQRVSSSERYPGLEGERSIKRSMNNAEERKEAKFVSKN